MPHDAVKAGDVDEHVDDDAPGIDGVGRARQHGTGQDDHQGHLESARERLPPDKDLPEHDAFARVIDAVLGEVFDEGRAGAHFEEGKDHGEELQHPAPHAEAWAEGRMKTGRIRFW